MKQRLQKVLTKDFDIVALRKAAREGRLYIEPAAEYEPSIEPAVLEYVNRIEEFATLAYQGAISKVWRRIANDPSLSPLLKSSRETINKYRVTAIAIFLYNKGCYDFPTATAMHLQLEGVAKRNKYYTNGSNYELRNTERNALCSIIEEVKRQKA